MKIARDSFESFFRFDSPAIPTKLPMNLRERHGCFVRVRKSPDFSWGEHMDTLASLGYPLPSKELAATVVDSAIACAVHIKESTSFQIADVEHLLFEVSVLTEPELLKATTPVDFLRAIERGRDGIIVEYGFAHGLILPQVSIENNFDQNVLLSECCMQAGLPPSSWLALPGIRVYKFQAEIFREMEPNGNIVEFTP